VIFMGERVGHRPRTDPPYERPGPARVRRRWDRRRMRSSRARRHGRREGSVLLVLRRARHRL